jgi:hypothetical protein
MEIDRTVLSSKRLRLSASVLILAIYVASLMLPAVLKTDTSAAHDAGYPGYSILMIGWLGVANLQPAWIANPLLLLTLAMPTRALGIATAVFAACAIGWREIPNDAGVEHVLSYGAGYYLWMLAMALTASLPFVLKAAKQRRS